MDLNTDITTWNIFPTRDNNFFKVPKFYIFDKKQSDIFNLKVSNVNCVIKKSRLLLFFYTSPTRFCGVSQEVQNKTQNPVGEGGFSHLCDPRIPGCSGTTIAPPCNLN